MNTEDISDLIRDVCDRVIVPRWRSLTTADIDEKTPGDPVTIADREAEAELTAAFGRLTPGALVVGEENAFAHPGIVKGLVDAEHAWVIDPVDGTANFARGTTDFGVMVAEVRAGETVRSWIWQPKKDALYVAEKGAGATLNGELLPRLTGTDAPWRVATWPRLKTAGQHRIEIVPTHRSCAIDYPEVATGVMDGLAYRKLHPWDHLPGCLLVAEAGGTVLLDRGAFRPGGTGRLLAIGSSERLARSILDAADGVR